jgi:hypothetical protein
MKVTAKILVPQMVNFRSRVSQLSLVFEEDPQLTPGRCWERRRQDQELKALCN